MLVRLDNSDWQQVHHDCYSGMELDYELETFQDENTVLFSADGESTIDLSTDAYSELEDLAAQLDIDIT